MLRKPQPRDLSWLQAVITPGVQNYTLQLAPRDDAGAQAFGELKNRGLSQISDALYQSAGHVLGFLTALRAELAFYIGCLNLANQLAGIGEAIAFPEATEVSRRFHCQNLRDVCLALTMGRAGVSRWICRREQLPLVIITGANRGGR